MRLEQRIKKLIQKRRSIGLPGIGAEVIKTQAQRIANYLRYRKARLEVKCEICERFARFEFELHLSESIEILPHYFCSDDCQEMFEQDHNIYVCEWCGASMVHAGHDSTCELLDKCLCFGCKSLPQFKIGIKLLGGLAA